MAEVKRRTYGARPTFGDNAPSSAIPYPKQANMTVVEILAFLPNSINCADVIYRMTSNGGTRRSIHAIINTYRDFEAEWSANCCGEAMYKTMNKAGYTDWTIKKHNLWHDSKKALWDTRRLDVGGLRTPSTGHAETVSFSRLDENVRAMPEGDDALDLTRMVQYCVQNSEDGWIYPNDYDELLELLGGPAKVQEPNTDGAVFRRWEDKKAPPPTPRPTQPPQAIGLPKNWKKTRRSTNETRRQSLAETAPSLVSPVLGPLLRRGAATENVGLTTGFAVNKEAGEWTEIDKGGATPYHRGLAEYVLPPATPPPGIASSRSSSNIMQILQAEASAGETDPYSAYAFKGPRRTPPYRYLHEITLPHPWDTSGWAENLRWAFEQHVLFVREFPEVSSWSESPEHMARVERERMQRVWASDELLEQLMEVD